MFGATWYKALIIIGVYVTFYMLLIGEEYLNRMVQRESAINRQYFTTEIVDQSEERATRWFTKTFVDTGVMAHSFDMFIPTQEEIDRTPTLDPEFGQPIFGWFERRVRAWWTLIWSSYTRASALLIWLPLVPLFIIPWAVDGWTQRQRRKHTFEIASATRQHVSIMALTAIPLLLVAVITSPILLHPMFAPLMLLASGALIYAVMSNFMKRA